MKKKKLTRKEIKAIVNEYKLLFDEEPYCPRGCKIFYTPEMAALMDMAIRRGEPLKLAEYKGFIQIIETGQDVTF